MANLDTSREHRIYLAIWKKAGLMEEDLMIQLKSYNQAVSMRLGMYRAIQPYRTGKATDPELASVAETYAIHVPTGENILIIRKKVNLSAAEILMADLGIEESDLETFEEQEMRSRLSNIMDETDQSEASNPFYSR